MKKLAIAFAIVLVGVAAGLFWLRDNIDGLIRDAIVKYGSDMTLAGVSVGSVELRGTDGGGVIRDLTIGNPLGFKTPYALKVGEIEVVVDVASVARDVVVVRRIAVKAPDVIYEKGEAMTNFDALQKNVAAYAGASATKGERGKKLIVEEFIVTGAKAQASAGFMQGKTVTVPLPDIALRDLGKAKGGIPPGELGQEVAAALKQRLSSAISFDALAKSVGRAYEKTSAAIKGWFK
jgi:hypothetical protein